MSYLQIPNGIPDFAKAAISFWFRVPRESLAAVANKADVEFKAAQALQDAVGFPSGYVFPRMHTILPLLTFGPMFEGYQVKSVAGSPLTYARYFGTYTTGSGYSLLPFPPDIQNTTDGERFEKFSKFLANPSFIGVRTQWIYDDDGNPTDALDTVLVVRVQMKDQGSGSWVSYRSFYSFSDSITLQSSDAGVETDTAWDYDFCSRSGVYPDGTFVTNVTLVDETAIVAEQYGPEAFEGRFSTTDDAGNNVTVVPDQWHHVLVSFDLSNAIDAHGSKYVYDQPDCIVGAPLPDRVTLSAEEPGRVDNPCQMWIAFDDFNALNVSDDAAYLLGPNGVAPYNCTQAAKAVTSGRVHFKNWIYDGQVQIGYNDVSYGRPTYSYEPQLVPANGYPLGIPCVSELVDSIYRVEMAEFQMFTGVTLDTGVDSNRRAFIDYERNDQGAPIKDKDGNFTLKPVPPVAQPPTDEHPEDGVPAPADKLLGKRPEILLHGNSNWIDGKNTGTTGVDYSTNPPTVKPSGQFQPTGGIKKYTPDPSLEQSPPPGSGRKARPVLTKKPANARL